MPLIASNPAFTEKSLEGALTVFRDALPGKWGRCILEDIIGRTLTDSEALLANQADRIGNLVFSRNKVYPNIDHDFLPDFEWAELLEAKYMRFWDRRRFQRCSRHGCRLLGYMEVFTPASETFADSKIVGYR